MTSSYLIQGLFIILMLILFAGIVFWAYHPARKQQFKLMAGLPLESDDRVNKPEEQR